MKTLFVIFAILFIGCGAEPEHDSVPQPLVFDDLSIRQGSDIVISAGTLSISDEMIEEYYKGKALDSVARLKTMNCPVVVGGRPPWFQPANRTGSHPNAL